MLFTSTRTRNLDDRFSQAVSECIPDDGGVFVPDHTKMEDLRNWIYYIDKETSFKSIAGTLTSAFLREDYSPIISETIAKNAFPFEPVFKQIDNQLFHLELTNGYTGCHRDYGVSYLCSYLETIHELKGGQSVFLDFTHGEMGALLARTLKDKKHIKAVLLYEKDTVYGISEDDLYWNGGNIYPIQMEKTETEMCDFIKSVFEDKQFCKMHGLTVANTTNVGRLMAQIFIYPYSFSRIKEKIYGDIFYSVDAGNYATLMAGLYSWRFALPISGFYVPSTPGLSSDCIGNPILLDSFISFDKRDCISPVVPANLERLEAFFGQNQMMMRNFVYPIEVTEEETDEAAQELFTQYGIYVDERAARSYATIRKNGQNVFDEGGAFVLVSQRHPGLSSDFCRHVLGEAPDVPRLVKETNYPFEIHVPTLEHFEDIKQILEKI